jgi:hypothetical protein
MPAKATTHGCRCTNGRILVFRNGKNVDTGRCPNQACSEMPELRVGARLKNDATLLAWKEERDELVVLALNEKNEFVTWKLGADGNTYSGRYFTTLLYAIDDFKKRS